MNIKNKYLQALSTVLGIVTLVLGYVGIIVLGNVMMQGATLLLSLGFFLLLFFINKRATNNQISTTLTIIVVALVGSFVFLSITFYVVQDEQFAKNNAIFQPRLITKIDSSYYAEEDKNIENISIKTADNININGWLVKNSTDEKLPLILFFAGSGQEVSGMIRYAKKLEGWSVALINYRGFGISEGVPSQDAVFSDATLIYDTLARRSDINNEKIVTMGWSLGTAVSVYLAANRPTVSVILVSPLHSMADQFKGFFPLLPLSLLMNQPFDSASRAPLIETPLFALIGDEDRNVSLNSSLRLIDNWKGPQMVKRYESEDHFLLFHGNKNSSWEDIKKYLATL